MNDLTGKTFGRLQVVRKGYPHITKGGRSIVSWWCKCSCKRRSLLVIGASLVSGNTASCGCLKLDTCRKRMTKHGKKGTRAHNSWSGMKQRCNYTNHKDYKNYGAKGVKVCERWDSFENFLSDMGEPPTGKTLDRIDPYGNYEPSNCRWADAKTQAGNKRCARCDIRRKVATPGRQLPFGRFI